MISFECISLIFAVATLYILQISFKHYLVFHSYSYLSLLCFYKETKYFRLICFVMLKDGLLQKFYNYFIFDKSKHTMGNQHCALDSYFEPEFQNHINNPQPQIITSASTKSSISKSNSNSLGSQSQFFANPMAIINVRNDAYARSKHSNSESKSLLIQNVPTDETMNMEQQKVRTYKTDQPAVRSDIIQNRIGGSW